MSEITKYYANPVMMRPDWEQLYKSKLGTPDNPRPYFLCSCNAFIVNDEMFREHWQRGHFDIVKEAIVDE